MLKHRWTDRVCCIVLVLMLLATGALMGAQSAGLIAGDIVMGYENRLFDQSRVHTVDIVMDGWEDFLETCTNEEYAPCTVVIDGEVYENVGLRAKGNTSLSSVRQYGSSRYSFKVEFDQYGSGFSYHGLDKLSLNNLIQDNTYLKDYMVYTMMNKMGAAAPLCSFARITVNGEEWGLYMAVEAVEDSFLRRNYGADYGELYKPDSMSFGGGRGNGRDFSMDDFAEKFRENTAGGESEQAEGSGFTQTGGFDPAQMGEFDFSQFGGMTPPDMGNFDPSQMGGMTLPDMGNFDPSQMGGMTPPDMGNFDPSQMGGGFGMGSSDVRLQYTDDDPASYPNIFDSAKTAVTPADQSRLIAALKAMNEGDTSAVDTEAVMRYLAVHDFVCNGDSYTGMMVHNYYLYEEDGVLSMLPWDYNLAMGAFSMGGGFGGMSGGATGTVNSPIDSPVSGGDVSSRPMVAWIFDDEETTARYHEIYSECIETLFESGWFEETVTAVSEMIAPYVESDPTKFCTYEQFTEGVEALKEFGRLRAGSVRGQLDGTIPSTREGQNADSSALVDASHLDLSVMGSFGMGGGFGGFGGRNGRSDAASSATRKAPEASGEQDGGKAAIHPDGTESAEPEAAAEPQATENPASDAVPPDMGEMPGGMTSPDMGNMPGNMTPPDMGNMPGNMTPPDMGNMPEGMTFPDMGNMPKGMNFPDMGNMPEGMSPPDMSGMPQRAPGN